MSDLPGHSIALSFKADSGAMDEACQRCGRALPPYSLQEGRAMALHIYDSEALLAKQGRMYLFGFTLCRTCATWLADRIYASAHDRRSLFERKGGRVDLQRRRRKAYEKALGAERTIANSE